MGVVQHFLTADFRRLFRRIDNLAGFLAGFVQLLALFRFQFLAGLFLAPLDFFFRFPDHLFVFALERFRLGFVLCRLGLPLVILCLPPRHELFDRLVEDEIQSAGQNGEIEEMQQDLLPVDIQWHSPAPAFLIRRR